MRIAVTICLFLLLAFCMSEVIACKRVGEIDRYKIINYINAWAKDINEDLPQNSIVNHKKEKILILIGNILFESDDNYSKLIIRCSVDRRGYKYINRQEYLEELEKISIQNPSIIAGGKFELHISPLSKKKGYWLSIRKDIIDDSLSTNEFVKIIHKLANTAHYWKGTTLSKVILKVNSKLGPYVPHKKE